MSNKPNRNKRTSTHGGDLGRIICGVFEDQDGAVSAHVWDQRELGWTYKDYCLYTASMLQTVAELNGTPIETIWDCVTKMGLLLEEHKPIGSKPTKH